MQEKLKKGLFVSGTGTSVGKTTVSAGLVKMLHAHNGTRYWKPVQTGTVIGDDTGEVQELTGLSEEAFMEPGYRFPQPLAPWIAARAMNKEIDLNYLKELQDQSETPLIVEGAGGLLVPMTSEILQIEFIKQLGLPLLLVSENKLGTMNQTLLSIRACREFGVDLLGVVLTRAQLGPKLGNRESIERFGRVEILAEFDEAADRRMTASRVSTDEKLRALFGVPVIPL